MPSIQSLEMGSKILSNAKISIKKSLFGQTAIYLPTNSKLKAYRQGYNADNGIKVERILNAPTDKLEETIKGSTIKQSDIGNVQLEACVSSDGQFAAFKLFRFVDFKYKAISDLKLFEGDQAKLIASIL